MQFAMTRRPLKARSPHVPSSSTHDTSPPSATLQAHLEAHPQANTHELPPQVATHDGPPPQPGGHAEASTSGINIS